LQHQRGVQPDGGQRVLHRQDAGRDDRGRLHLPAVRAALPGLDLLGLPQADQRGPTDPAGAAGPAARASQPMRPLDPRLLQHARQAKVYIAAVSGLGVLTAGLVIAQAQLLATGITAAFLHGGTLSALRGTLAALAAVVAGRVVLAWATEATSYHASAAVKAELRRRLLARATELGPRWLAGQRQAELTALAPEGVEAPGGYFAEYLPQLVLASVVPVAVLVRVGWSDLLAGLTIAVTLPLIPLFGAMVGKATSAHARRRWRTLAVLSHHFLDVTSGLPTLKVFGRAKAQREV